MRLEMGGIPIATLLSHLSGIPAAFVRKEAKTYGTCKLAEGCNVSGKRLLIVEDVVTTGGQIIKSASQLQNIGAITKDVICVIDREFGGNQNLKKEGLVLTSLFNYSELKKSI